MKTDPKCVITTNPLRALIKSKKWKDFSTLKYKRINYASIFQEQIVNISYGDYFSSCRATYFAALFQGSILGFMKKKITTEQELLLDIAAHGDAAAFYSLISSSLKEYFLKLRSHGESPEESADKTFEKATTLFKKFQNANPENFNQWLESANEETSQHANGEHEIILDRNQFLQCDAVLAETQKRLLRTASALKQKRRKKGIVFFFSKHKMVAVSISILLILGISSVVLFGFYGVKIGMSLSIKAPFLQDSTSIQDSIVAKASSDSIAHTDSTPKVVIPETPVQESKPVPPPPKPRPRVTYSAPVTTESEASDQVQQSNYTRSEKTSQPQSYSSQVQQQDNQTSPSYSTSGSSSYSNQQSSQQQNQGTQEQNQP
jgi:hypothetical protein